MKIYFSILDAYMAIGIICSTKADVRSNCFIAFCILIILIVILSIV